MNGIRRTGRLATEDAHSRKNAGRIGYGRGVSQHAKEQAVELNWYILCRRLNIAS